MSNDNEPAKLLLPYLQRADELQKHEPLVAYYCRLYAMERGLKFPQSERTKVTNNLLVSLMKQLEKDKKSLKLGPDDQLHLEGFALNVFENADKQDRAGRANLNTAKTFYAASIFFEILNQFGELQPDLEQKQKYAVWKAADIRKAIKEGRAPVPGPPGGEENFSVPASTSSGEYDVEPSRPDPAIKSAPVHSPSQFYDEVNRKNTADIPPPSFNNSPPAPPPSYSNPDFPSHEIHPSQNIRSEDTSSPRTYHHQQNIRSEDISSPQTYHHQQNIKPEDNSSPQTYHHQQNIRSEDPSSPQTYHHQPYQQDPYQQFPQNYPSHEAPSHSSPHFQSYPSFTESSLPTAPPHHPSYFQGPDTSYPNLNSVQYNSQNSFGSPRSESAPAPSKAPIISNQPIYSQGNASGRNGSAYDNVPAPTQTYQYDSNYQPPPEKIAEAHKAARYAVGALAFDDVPTAVDFLKKSLELLTNPAAGH